MTEDENRPPLICGVFNNNNTTPNAENYFYTTANYYYQVGHQSTAAHFYERTSGGGIDLSQLSGSSAFRPVHPGSESKGGDKIVYPSTVGSSALHIGSSSNTNNSNNGMKSKKYNSRYPLPEKPRQKRAVIQDMVRPLKQWLVRHRHNPYPTKTEKVQLALGSNMTLVQVSNWFANARRRLKNVVQDHRCSWSKRLRMYNQFVQGNAELLSIASDDSIWNSEDEDETCDNRKTAHRQPLCHEEEDSCGRTPASSADGLEDGPSSPSLGKDGSPKYKTSILHRYLADSVESTTKTSSHLPIRPVPNRSKEDNRLYKPYKVVRSKKMSESSHRDDEDHLVVVDDDEPKVVEEDDQKVNGLGPFNTSMHHPPSFPLWHHPAFPLPSPLFSPFLASSLPHKDILKLLYSDALISRSKDLSAASAPPPVVPTPSSPYERLIDRLANTQESINQDSSEIHGVHPLKSSLDLHPPSQAPSSTPALFI